MSDASVALVVCGNGYGHTRRMVSVASALAKERVAVTMFARAEATKRFAQRPGCSVDAVEVVDFDTATSAKALRSNDVKATRWDERLPDIDGFSIVVSDNLPEILARREDAILCGNFFWHKSVTDAHPNYRERAHDLIRRFRPEMLASGLFAPDYLQKATRLHEVGLWRCGMWPSQRKTDILISCGLGGEAGDQTAALIRQVAAGARPAYRRVHVEPSMLPVNPPEWMVPASFHPDMFARLLAAVCRPGLGTVTDCMQFSGARVFAFYEGNNQEMLNGAARIKFWEIGADCLTAEQAYAAAIQFVGSPAQRAAQKAAVARLPIDGVEKTVSFLMNRL